MELEDETLKLYILIQDSPELTVNDAIKSVRGERSLRDAAYQLFLILTKNLDYRNDPKIAAFLHKLVSIESLRLKLPVDFPQT